MYEIDRIVAILKPTAKMLRWLQGLSTEFTELTLEDIRSDCTALLIPTFDEPDMAHQYIEEIYADIFENELELWVADEDKWPENRTLEVFLTWFNVEFHSMVLDLGGVDEISPELHVKQLQ